MLAEAHLAGDAMAYFMDVHSNMRGVTLADVEQAHLRDVEAQDKYGVKYLRFFHDQVGEQVYCVAEAPSAEACAAVHRAANGMEPERIIPVEPMVMEGFLGGGSETESGVAVTAEGVPDSGIRTIMFTDIVDSTRLTDELGDEQGVELVAQHDAVARRELASHEGREVKHTGDGLMASFRDASRSIGCAVGFQRALAEYRSAYDALPLQVRIGLNSGVPVAARGDLFGIAVNLSRRICDGASADEILISESVHELAGSEEFGLQGLGAREFKGVSGPVAVHRVLWS